MVMHPFVSDLEILKWSLWGWWSNFLTADPPSLKIRLEHVFRPECVMKKVFTFLYQIFYIDQRHKFSYASEYNWRGKVWCRIRDLFDNRTALIYNNRLKSDGGLDKEHTIFIENTSIFWQGEVIQRPSGSWGAFQRDTRPQPETFSDSRCFIQLAAFQEF